MLQSLNEHKATGPDGITNKILKETAQQTAPSSCLLFNLSLRCDSLLEEWKTSNIVPVFKKGKPSHVENYRPISLLSNIFKVLERCILDKIRKHLLQYMSENQHGFVPGRSCTTQLVQVLECIGQQLDQGKQTDIIVLDIWVKRLTKFNIVYFWKSYERITLREIYTLGFLRICVDGNSALLFQVVHHLLLQLPQAFHKLHPWPCTVPHLYVNEIHDIVDDTKLFKTIHSGNDANLLQEDLNNLSNWSK